MTNKIDHSELVLRTDCWMAHLLLLSPFSERDVRHLVDDHGLYRLLNSFLRVFF